ncbi:MAG: DUF2716 domain-containing protein [Cytophagaceae bacterium]
MKNWGILSQQDYSKAWDFINNELSFKPNSNGEGLIKLPSPNKKYDIHNFYNENFSEELYNNLHNYILGYFKQLSKGNRLLALDWQHDCFSFDPHLPFEKDEFDEWLIPAFPNGDYLFFLTKDFKNGIFADGINLSISFFGDDLINIIQHEKPEILR